MRIWAAGNGAVDMCEPHPFSSVLSAAGHGIERAITSFEPTVNALVASHTDSRRLIPTLEERPSARIASKPSWQGVSNQREKHLHGHAFTEKPDNDGHVCYQVRQS